MQVRVSEITKKNRKSLMLFYYIHSNVHKQNSSFDVSMLFTRAYQFMGDNIHLKKKKNEQCSQQIDMVCTKYTKGSSNRLYTVNFV